MTATTSPLFKIEPGVKVAAQMSPEASEEDLQFVRALGVEYVVLWTDATKSSAEYYASRREKFAQYGLKVYGFGNADVHNQDEIVLKGPNFQAKVAQYQQHLRDLGKAGIPYTTYAHMPNGIWSTEPEFIRGRARARAFNLDTATAGHWHGKEYSLPLTNGREYTDDEVWGYFEEFITQVAPVAEQAGVLIGIHPDDPPIPRLGGVPRIFSTFEGYKRALVIANSPNVGVCLCLGCWLEGGEGMGASPEEAIRYFAGQNKLFKVHFRNVDKPLPHFVETFIENGYANMYELMKTLSDAGFRGVAIPDHIPRMAPDGRAGTAYSIAFMRAYLERANVELGKS